MEPRLVYAPQARYIIQWAKNGRLTKCKRVERRKKKPRTQHTAPYRAFVRSSTLHFSLSIHRWMCERFSNWKQTALRTNASSHSCERVAAWPNSESSHTGLVCRICRAHCAGSVRCLSSDAVPFLLVPASHQRWPTSVCARCVRQRARAIPTEFHHMA